MLQVVFKVVHPQPMPLYVGQVMDVYIQAVRPTDLDLVPRTLDSSEIQEGFDHVPQGPLSPPRRIPPPSPGMGPQLSLESKE